MSTFYVGKATYKAVLMIAKANKFDIEDAAGDDNDDNASPLSAEEEKNGQR